MKQLEEFRKRKLEKQKLAKQGVEGPTESAALTSHPSDELPLAMPPPSPQIEEIHDNGVVVVRGIMLVELKAQQLNRVRPVSMCHDDMAMLGGLVGRVTA